MRPSPVLLAVKKVLKKRSTALMLEGISKYKWYKITIICPCNAPLPLHLLSFQVPLIQGIKSTIYNSNSLLLLLLSLLRGNGFVSPIKFTASSRSNLHITEDNYTFSKCRPSNKALSFIQALFSVNRYHC